MAYDQGAPQFGLNDARLAAYTSTGVYGTLTDIFSIEMSQATLQLVNGIARGDDKITAVMAVIEGVQLQLRFTGLNPSTLAIITGKSITTISSVKQLQWVGGEQMPYTGLIVKANAADGTDTWVFFPMAKLIENFTFFAGEYGRFSSPQLTLQCIPDTTWGLANIITHPSNVAITVIPPTNIAQAP